MKLVIQRVTRAAVRVDDAIVGKIGRGLLILLGIQEGDTLDQANQLATKVMKVRLWPCLKEPSKQWVTSVVDNDYGVLVISQFTLFATFKKPKPDFHRAMGGDEAKVLYSAFVEKCRQQGKKAERIATGEFGAMMQVELENDGPVTVELVADQPAQNSASVLTVPKSEPKAVHKVENLNLSTPADGGGVSCAGIALPDELQLEELLGLQSYVAGHGPTLRDAQLFAQARALGIISYPSSMPNLSRWLEHIGSFGESERLQWK